MEICIYPKGLLEWRELARELLAREVPPDEVLWQSPEQNTLFAINPVTDPKAHSHFKVSKEFLSLANTVAVHRSGRQWFHLYRALWRITHGERHLLSLSSDKDVHHLKSMEKHIRRDIHKMHAFVRFRKVDDCPETGREQFVAWFEPDHKIVPLTAGFFKKRFTGMNWSILTPDECMHWNGQRVHFTPGADQSFVPSADEQDELWKSYYRHIFNPARVKIKAMQSEMPKKYWKNLPEASIIKELIATSGETVAHMHEREPSPEKKAPKNAYLDAIKNLPS